MPHASEELVVRNAVVDGKVDPDGGYDELSHHAITREVEDLRVLLVGGSRIAGVEGIRHDHTTLELPAVELPCGPPLGTEVLLGSLCHHLLLLLANLRLLPPGKIVAHVGVEDCRDSRKGEQDGENDCPLAWQAA